MHSLKNSIGNDNDFPSIQTLIINTDDSMQEVSITYMCKSQTKAVITCVTVHKYSISGREFILRTCDVGAVWHLTPRKISPSQNACFGHKVTGK